MASTARARCSTMSTAAPASASAQTDEAGQGAVPHLDGHPGRGVHATELAGHVYRAQHHAVVRFDRRRCRTSDGAPGGAATGSIRACLDTIRGLLDRDGTSYDAADFGPAVPKPRRILCLGVNYAEHALEGGRQVPTWPEAFVRGADSVLPPYADLVRRP